MELEADPQSLGFKAIGWGYKVRFRCESGAGLYALRVERDRSTLRESASTTYILNELNGILELTHWTPRCFEKVYAGITGLLSKDLQLLVARKCVKPADYGIKTNKVIAYSYVKYEIPFGDLDLNSIGTAPGKILIRCKGGTRCVTAEGGFKGEDDKEYPVKLLANKESSAVLALTLDVGYDEVKSWRSEKIVRLVRRLIK